MRIGAGHICRQPIDLMYETVALQEIQCAVGDRRLRSKSFVIQLAEDRICAQGQFGFEQDFKDSPTRVGELKPVVSTVFLGRQNGSGYVLASLVSVGEACCHLPVAGGIDM